MPRPIPTPRTAPNRRLLAPLWATAVALVLAAPAVATVEVGFPPDAFPSATCYPFGCTDQFPSNRYQQVYSAGEFEGSISIGEIQFFQTIAPGGNLNDGSFEIRLSTTPTAVNSLDTTFANNVGGNEVLFATVADLNTAFDGSVLSITSGVPFFYDPSEGNLLLDVQILGVEHTGASAFFDARIGTADGATSRMHNFNGVYDDTGLSTRFLVPEPAAGSLVLAGLLALSSLRRRR